MPRRTSLTPPTSAFTRTALRALCCTGLALLFLGCHSSPTEPDDVYICDLSGTIETVDGSASIVRFQGLLDGKPFDGVDTSSGPLRNTDRISFVGHASPGRHTVELRILDQQGASNAYRVSGLKFQLNAPSLSVNTVVGSVSLPDATQTLATGQGIFYTFSI
jgi:hypothetical protein